jgi:glutaredoxin-like YruB-family protein
MEQTQKTQKHIMIYSTPTCTYCHHLKDYLTEKGFTYEDIDVTKDYDAMVAAVQKSGQKGVPVTDIEGKIIVGFDQDEIDQTLGITK